MKPDRPEMIRKPLLTWYDKNRRDLPWRRTSDPYAIWVSEIMLQQTRVDTVIPYWEGFLRCFPTIQSLAEASVEEVLALWSGLGYYARGRNLHAAAQEVVARHDGFLPQEEKELRSLPGIGAYTAGAILSIAFSKVAPLVDGNVIRVLSRVFRVGGDPSKGVARKKLWALAREVIAPLRPGDFNQALMELGAQICSPSDPSCPRCPLVDLCGARAKSAQDRYPGSKASVRRRQQAVACAAVVRRGKVLLAQRPKKGLLGGMWELPAVDVEHGGDGQKMLRDQLRGRVGVAAMKVGKELMRIEHQFTHIDMTYLAYPCEVTGRARAGQGYIAVAWVLPEELPRYGIGAATRKMLRRVFSHER